MMKEWDHVIIGSGIMGLSLAFHLSKLDEHLKILIIDKEKNPINATSASSGIYTHHFWDLTTIKLIKKSLNVLEELFSRENKTMQEQEEHAFWRIGFLTLGNESKNWRLLNILYNALKGLKIPAELMHEQKLHEHFPIIKQNNLMGVYTSLDGILNKSLIIQKIIEHLKKDTIEIRKNVALTRLITNDTKTRVEFMQTNLGNIKAKNYIMTAGAWSKELLMRSNLMLPTKAYLLPVVVFDHDTAIQDMPIIHDLNEEFVMFRETPKSIGIITNYDFHEIDPDHPYYNPPAHHISSIQEYLGKMLHLPPRYERLKIISAPCTATPDRKPIVGRYPNMDDLYVATGMNGFGFLRSFGIAKDLAEYIIDETKVSTALKEYSPDRFVDMSDIFSIKYGFSFM